MLTEKAIHLELERLINNGVFYKSINANDIQKIKNITSTNENLLPAFSIDEYVRKRYAFSAENTLRSIEKLEILTSDNNISTQLNQILRPDLVCINPETQQVIIFEIKKSNQTERQALTELLAYEHEIKNLLPFISSHDLTFVLVSTEWSVLLEHAAGSAVSWANKNLLCLKANINKKNLTFNIHTFTSWKITGNVFFPPKSASSIAISFEANSSIEDSEITYRLDLLLNFFAREADKAGLHGFAITTTDLGAKNKRSYQIVFCAISPLAFFDNMLSSGQITAQDGHLVKKVERHKIKNGDTSGISSLDFLISKMVRPRLSVFDNVEFGNYTPWNVMRNKLKDQSLPTLVEFWGLPADYVRDYITNPAVLNARETLFAIGTTDWRYPYTGLWLIRNLFEPSFCRDGFVRPSDTFRLGITLGHDSYLRYVAKNSPKRPKNIEAAMFWNFSTLECYLDEIFVMARTAKTISDPKTPIQFSANVDYEIDHKLLIDWLTSEVLSKDKLHIKIFYLGLNLSQSITAEDLQPSNFRSLTTDTLILSELKATVKYILENSLNYHSYNEAEKLKLLEKAISTIGISFEELRDRKINLTHTDIDLIYIALKDILSLADLTMEAVTHIYPNLPAMHVDWDALKQGIDEMYKRGVRYPAIFISTSGVIGTASYDSVEYVKAFATLKDTDQEVFFMDGSSGIEFFKIEKWSDLRAGKIIRPPIP
ncbi:hypothetical protein PS3A_40300 [Pseudomonas sp. 3A(2025)]